MEWISKTQKKREAESLQELGERLLKLSEEQIRMLDLPENIVTAVSMAKTITKHGARKRQMQYIGVLMRKIDVAPIREALVKIEEGDRKQSAEHKQVERWRDELIRGNDALLNELVSALPEDDGKQLADLVMKSRKELLKTSPSPTPSRVLFRYLHRHARDFKSA